MKNGFAICICQESAELGVRLSEYTNVRLDCGPLWQAGDEYQTCREKSAFPSFVAAASDGCFSYPKEV